MKKGDILSTTDYLEVIKTGSTTDGKRAVWVKNLETGEELGITEDIALKCKSADSFSKTETLSLTEVVNILENVGDKVFTVNFNKQAVEADIYKKLSNLSVKDRENKKKVVECLQGEERTLRGRLINTEPKLGRSSVIDLTIEKQVKGDFDNRQRLVDHRSINWLIVNDVKYLVK